MTKLRYVPYAVLAAGGLLAASGAANAQSMYDINQRQDYQQNRIEQGVRSGQITRSEEARLEQGERNIDRAQRQAEADGRVTAAERARIDRMTDRQSREEIRAPMDGVVNKIFVQTVGGVVRGGEPLFEIVPVEQSVMIEARIAPKDRGRIHAGLPAIVKVSAYEFATYGGLNAKVVDISPDVLQDPKGEVYYRVRLRADTKKFGKDKPVIPGMTAEVDIRAGGQTVLDYLLSPIRGVGDNAFRQ